MPRAASVWLDVMPSMSEFRRELRRNLEQPVAESAARAGAQGGEGLMSGLRGKMLAGAAAAGVAVGSAIAVGIEQAVAKQKATGKLKAQLDLSAADAKKAGAAAGRLYAGTVTETVDEAAASVRATMAAGLAPSKATTKQLAEISTKVQDLSTLFEVDLGQAANAAGQAVKTGLAKNSAEALDVMYRGFQIMGPRADDLADTFNEYSTIFRSLGLDMQTVTGLFSQGMKAGARDTDVVADALKEFQIRTTDGSTASAAGFKALGMNAKKATAMFAKGGAGAAAGLQTVLDKLRGMKNPVDQNAAAVALFGTKAEDLGQALYTLDPSKAVADLGQVGGAAKRAGDALRSDAGSKFEAFKRRGLTALGDVTAKYVLPRLEDLIDFVDTRAVPTIKAITGGFQSSVQWVREYGVWLTPLAAGLGTLGALLYAGAAAAAVNTAATATWATVTGIATTVTTAFSAAQMALRVVWLSNPIFLVIAGVVALGVGLVVAYKKSETFRNIVQGVWSAIKSGWTALWEGGLKPGFEGFMVGLRAVGTAATWLWGTVLSPVFGAISMGARILVTAITVLLLIPILVGVKAFGAVFGWLWTNAISPAFSGIATGAQWLWGIVGGQISLFMAGLRLLGGVAMWLYNAAVKPVVGWTVAGFKLMWAGVKLQVSLFMTGLRLLGATGTWLWKNAISPALHGVVDVALWMYKTGLKPPIDKAIGLAKALGGAFKSGAGVVGDAFKSLQDKAKKPVAYVIDIVYNKGIVGVWNKVAGAFGAPELHTFKGFRKGGILDGQSSYRDGDDQLMPMRRGEGVAVSEAMRDPYERSRLLAVNQAAMQGRSLAPFQGGGFAKGGIFGWVKNAASSVGSAASAGVDWLKDGVKASAEAGLNKIVQPLINKISGSASLYRDMITGVPKKMIKSILGYGGTADSELAKAGVGGKRFSTALAWGRTQVGLPYQWGGNGDPSWDCSGLVSALESVIRGEAPHRRWATGAFSGKTAPPGWVLGAKSPYMIGVTNAGVGHTAGTLNGVNVESRGGDGVVIGSRARSYMDPLFTHRYGLRGFADGGSPRPGEIAWVGENGPELMEFRGGEVVYSNAESMRMTAGLGPVRGFAKGTTSSAAAKSQAKARGEIPGDLTTFRKSLTGTAAAIQKAADALTKDLAAAGKAGQSLVTSTEAASAKLQTMAKARDAVTAKIKEAKSYAADKAGNLASFLGVANVGDATSVGALISGLQGKQATAKKFEASLATLQKRGASRDLIDQLGEMGPDSTLAGLVAGASTADLKRINGLVKANGALSKSYGNAMADLMFDAGKDASKGFLAGLVGEEKAIQAAMAKLGNSAITAIRSKKGIDAHSPSRKGARAGADVGAGVVAGMAAMGPAVASAASRLGDAAVPAAALVPVTSQRSGTDPMAALDGMAVALVLEDGTALAAHFDTRVDAKLTTARRTARAGTKRR